MITKSIEIRYLYCDGCNAITDVKAMEVRYWNFMQSSLTYGTVIKSEAITLGK